MPEYKKERSQGATEYLLILAAVLVIVAVAVYFITSTGGYPTISVTAATDTVTKDNVILEVTSGSIAKADWAYCLDQDSTGDASWTTGTETLDAPNVSLENKYTSPGVWYVSLKHIPTGHLYFSNRSVTVEA